MIDAAPFSGPAWDQPAGSESRSALLGGREESGDGTAGFDTIIELDIDIRMHTYTELKKSS